MKTLATIVLSVASTLLILFLLDRAFSISDTPAYWEHLVLTEDVNLFYGDDVVGALKAGTTIHAPCNHDTIYTEPFDPKTYKIYVEFASIDRSRTEYTEHRSKFYARGGHARNVLAVLPAADLTEAGEQDAAGQPATPP